MFQALLSREKSIKRSDLHLEISSRKSIYSYLDLGRGRSVSISEGTL